MKFIFSFLFFTSAFASVSLASDRLANVSMNVSMKGSVVTVAALKSASRVQLQNELDLLCASEKMAAEIKKVRVLKRHVVDLIECPVDRSGMTSWRCPGQPASGKTMSSQVEVRLECKGAARAQPLEGLRSASFQVRGMFHDEIDQTLIFSTMHGTGCGNINLWTLTPVSCEGLTSSFSSEDTQQVAKKCTLRLENRTDNSCEAAGFVSQKFSRRTLFQLFPNADEMSTDLQIVNEKNEALATFGGIRKELQPAGN